MQPAPMKITKIDDAPIEPWRAALIEAMNAFAAVLAETDAPNAPDFAKAWDKLASTMAKTKREGGHEAFSRAFSLQNRHLTSSSRVWPEDIAESAKKRVDVDTSSFASYKHGLLKNDQRIMREKEDASDALRQLLTLIGSAPTMAAPEILEGFERVKALIMAAQPPPEGAASSSGAAPPTAAPAAPPAPPVAPIPPAKNPPTKPKKFSPPTPKP
jgi:hypothetical protein